MCMRHQQSPSKQTSKPTSPPISPLRQRMIDDTTIRNMSLATQRSYLHAVKGYNVYFGRSPERLGLEEQRAQPRRYCDRQRASNDHPGTGVRI